MNKKKKKTLISCAAVALFLILCLLAYFFLRPANTPREVLLEYWKAMSNCDSVAVTQLYPDEYIEYLMKEYSRNDKSGVALELSYKLKEYLRALKNDCGEDMTISCDIKDERYASSQDLERICTMLENAFGFPPDSASNAVTLHANVTFSGSSLTKSEEINSLLIKVNNQWYIIGD